MTRIFLKNVITKVAIASAVLVATVIFIVINQKLVYAENKPTVSDQENLISIAEASFSQEDMDEIVSHVDYDVVQEVTAKLGSATTREYIEALVEADPELTEILKDEYGVSVE